MQDAAPSAHLKVSLLIICDSALQTIQSVLFRQQLAIAKAVKSI